MMNRIEISGETKELIEVVLTSGHRIIKTNIRCVRNSDVVDTIPVLIHPEKMNFKEGDEITVVGELRSRHENGHLIAYVNAETIEVESNKGLNMVELQGHICRQQVFKQGASTIITEFMLCVNKAFSDGYMKSHYIPCVAWGKNANFAKECKIGDRVNLVGRIQSRRHSHEDRDVYEIAVGGFLD